ncbi:hypothetical protein JTE90_018476 [Oedothorax gibbosus]|uniref:Ultrabithorax n=1 Tax=Oedothorax gibbosus TaxID=931172 RepID=A0AAV6UE08_9ARAC|nr:hypothetical protein JTE90_018476 [Oedothorax gibbosus]
MEMTKNVQPRPGPRLRGLSPVSYRADATNGGNAAASATAAACKLYSNSVGESSTLFKPECLAKDQNGFNQAVKEMASWPSSSVGGLRPSMGADAMRPFPGGDNSGAAAAPRVTDAWSTCCQSTPPMAQAPANAFYPWMAIAGWCKLTFRYYSSPRKERHDNTGEELPNQF